MAIKHKDYYEVLHVSRTATDEEIKLAYYKLAREHHPDIHPEKEKEVRTRRMQEVNEAYAVLGNKENRAKYDQMGEPGKEEVPPSAYQDPGGYAQPGSEAFSDFFRTMFRPGSGNSEPDERFSSELDVEAALELSLADAVKGAEKSFSLMATGLCQNCRGTGRKNNEFCPVCGGVGEARQRREVKTKIPPGLAEGSRIRLKGQGNVGPRARGDLYLSIHLLKDPNFIVDGLNLETGAQVMPWQAALGSETSVQTLDGPIRLRVPKGTHTGTRLRLAGKGLGKPGQRGDLFIRIEIDIPESLTPSSENLFKKLADENHV